MKFDFDRIIERRGTNSLKYDFARERGKREDVLPLWVADMDFQTAPPILERLEEVVHHGIFGYSEAKEDYFRALAGWYQNHFDWEVKRSWLLKTPGVVFAIAMAIRAFTEEGDAVLLQQPVYYPFSETILDNHRKLVNNPLKLENGHYEIDFNDFERKIAENHVKLFLLCSPHNPVGRVWKEWELRKLGEICLRYGVLVVSDEIHADFTYGNNKHLVFASLSPEIADITITCTAPSKTFNLAGLQTSNIFISNRERKHKFKAQIAACNRSRHGLLRRYSPPIRGSHRRVQLCGYIGVCDDNAKLFTVVGAEVDRKQAVDLPALHGRENIACPRATLERALTQLELAIKEKE